MLLRRRQKPLGRRPPWLPAERPGAVIKTLLRSCRELAHVAYSRRPSVVLRGSQTRTNRGLRRGGVGSRHMCLGGSGLATSPGQNRPSTLMTDIPDEGPTAIVEVYRLGAPIATPLSAFFRGLGYPLRSPNGHRRGSTPEPTALSRRSCRHLHDSHSHRARGLPVAGRREDACQPPSGRGGVKWIASSGGSS